MERTQTPPALTLPQRDSYLAIKELDGHYHLQEVSGYHLWKSSLADDYVNLCKTDNAHDIRMDLFVSFTKIYESCKDIVRDSDSRDIVRDSDSRDIVKSMSPLDFVQPSTEELRIERQKTLTSFRIAIGNALSKVSFAWIFESENNDDIAFLRDFANIVGGDNWKGVRRMMKEKGYI